MSHTEEPDIADKTNIEMHNNCILHVMAMVFWTLRELNPIVLF